MNGPTRSRIRAACPHCESQVWLRPREVKLALDPVERDDRAGRYAFLCPSCSRIPVQIAGPALVRRLRAWGVEIVGVEDGFERATPVAHPEVAAHGPPLDHDDVLDLHELLQTDDWFDRLVELT